jgi:serine/threonine protein phosphatase 1
MRILAIGDIHGCLTAFTTLLEAVAPQPDDLLITLGDYVDRGPDSRGVLDRLLQLHETGRLVALRGNHDLMFLQARHAPEERPLWLGCGGKQTLASYGITFQESCAGELKRIPESHWRFLEDTCVDYYEAATHFFVHANAYPDIPVPEQPLYMLHWEKLGPTFPHVSGKVMVCGHTKQVSGEVLNRGHMVCIDTGAYADGWLTCLDVTTGRVWQTNQRGELRTGHLPPEEESPSF